MKHWPVLAIALMGIVLFLAEFLCVEREPDSVWLLAAISLLPMLCFAGLTVLELKAVGQKRQAQSGTLIGAYMLFKGLRLLLTIVAVAIYIYVGAPLRLLFVCNVCILFVVALAATSVCHLRAERKESISIDK